MQMKLSPSILKLKQDIAETLADFEPDKASEMDMIAEMLTQLRDEAKALAEQYRKEETDQSWGNIPAT